MKVWIDGQLVDQQQATVSVSDHGVLYGDGVFEGIRAYNGRIFQARAHVDRLFESAAAIRLNIPYTPEQLLEATDQTLGANNLSDAYIRMVVTRGAGTLGLSPFRCPKPCTFIITGQITMYPAEMYENGMAVIIAKTRRTSASMLPPSVKSLNYLNNILGKIEAIDAGVHEAIMLNQQGVVAEATGDNVFIVERGELITPPASAGILIGITRGVVIRLAREMGIPVVERDVTVEQLLHADECFMTGTAAEVIAVSKIDQQQIGDGRVGPITARLLQAFRDFIRSGKD